MTYPRLALVCLFAVGFWLSANSAIAQQTGCFDKLHDATTPRDADYLFDLKFDRNLEGSSFSCALVMRASDARKALDDFRAGVLYDDEAAITRAVRFPLTAYVYKTREINETGEAVTIRSVAEWIAFKKDRFSSKQVALVSCANVRNVEIATSRTYAFMIGSGTVKFQQPVPDKYPRVTGISLFPVTDEILVRFCAR